MVAFDGSEWCRQAEAYYHDYLQDPRDPSIPEAVVAHIEACTHCQSRVQTLRETLRELNEHARMTLPEKDSQVIRELQSHFEYLDELLVCAQAKPFLCGLLAPSARIRVPTPITVHLDQCAACAEDLESLRGLELGTDQSARLGRLYRENVHDIGRLCPRAQSHATAFAAMAFEGIPSEILQHLCICPRCRQHVYEQRQELLNRALDVKAQARPLRCEEATMAGLFDYVIPYGLQSDDFRDPSHRDRAEHIRSCPACLEALQHIHSTISQIAERPDSDVATIYTAQDPNEVAGADIQPTPYGAYPIDVHVVHSRKPSGDDATIVTRLKRRIAQTTARPIARVAFLAAAMIPLAVLFIISLPAASALSIRQVDHAVARAKTVHVSMLGNDDKVMLQWWIARDKGLVIWEPGFGQAQAPKIYDLKRGQVTTVPWESAPLEYRNLDRSERQAVERSMRVHLESSALEDSVPRDAEMTRRSEDPETGHTGLDVYELTWDRPSGTGASSPRKLTLYIDPVTKLPKRREFFTWVPGLEEWHVQKVLYEYPDEETIEARRQELLSAR